MYLGWNFYDVWRFLCLSFGKISSLQITVSAIITCINIITVLLFSCTHCFFFLLSMSFFLCKYTFFFMIFYLFFLFTNNYFVSYCLVECDAAASTILKPFIWKISSLSRELGPCLTFSKVVFGNMAIIYHCMFLKVLMIQLFYFKVKIYTSVP